METKSTEDPSQLQTVASVTGETKSTEEEAQTSLIGHLRPQTLSTQSSHSLSMTDQCESAGDQNWPSSTKTESSTMKTGAQGENAGSEPCDNGANSTPCSAGGNTNRYDNNDNGKADSGAKTNSNHEDARDVITQGAEMELQIPREHARLDPLLTQIPKKAQHGLLMQCDLILTCIDVNEHYIALGTNIGLTFLYSRKDCSMQRLKSETSSDVITCVKLHHGVDHQLATGMASGTLCIFLIPSFISLHKKQLQKFDVKSVHRHYITCVEWSTNGMKLFSGDKSGHVVVTEVDFYQGQCKSSELLVEPPTEIIQLNYNHRVLLVSTKHRSFICRLDTTKEIVQVGQQERKIQAPFGATFIPGLCKIEDAMLYAVRPGCRIWLADMQGSVCNTHIFKDQISSGVREIPILKPSRSSFNPNAELQFGRLLMFGEHQLITYNATALYVLEPRLNSVVASQNCLGGIVDLAVHKDEVFLLRRHTDSAVMRLACQPEPLLPKGLPFDLPLAFTTADPITTTTTSTMTTAVTSTTTTVPSESSHKQQNKDENKTKTFFKKTFLSPFKKLDNFIHEHTHKEPTQATEQDLRPVIRSGTDSENNTSTRSSPNSSLQASQESLLELPPVVPLDSPRMAVHVFTPTDVQSPDSADSALSMFAEEVREKNKGAGLEGSAAVSADQEQTAEGTGDVSLPASQPQGGDIVFSHHMHKKKGKKKKGKDKAGDKDTDNISQSSFGAQAVEDNKPNHPSLPSSHEDILRRAEEALNSVDRLLKGGEDEQEKEEHLVNTVLSEGLTGMEESSENKDKDSTSVEIVSSTQTVVESLAEKPVSQDSTDGNTINTRGVVRQEPGEAETKVDTQTGVVPSQPFSSNTPAAQPVAPAKGKLSEILSNVPVAPLTETVPTVPNVSNTQAVPTVLAIPIPQRDASHTEETKPAVEREEDPLEAAERNLDSMTQRFKPPDKKEESVDDFYSMFSSPYSPGDSWESPSSTPKEHRSFADFDSAESGVDRQVSNSSDKSDSEKSTSMATVQKLANSWSEFTAPANIYSLALSSTHIWFTDKSEKIYYSALGSTKGIVWRKVNEPASQISVSPSGHIVWRVHRGRVFAGTKITQRRPEGLKWVEAVTNVSHVSVDDHCAWYVKANGEVMMQRGLSKERPCFRSLSVETSCPVKQVMARHGVVWAITETMHLMVRIGITNENPQGLEWHKHDREGEPFLFSSVTVDNEGIGWAVDILGQIWFTDQVTPQTPKGSGQWWQVPLSEYYVQDPSVLDMIRSIAKKFDPHKLSSILSTNRGGLIVAGLQGVWIALDYLNTLYVCRSSLQGYQWSVAQPHRMASSTTWKMVQASIADLDWGLVWAQRVNRELYVLPPDGSDATLIDSLSFVSYSVNEHAVWGLTMEGDLYVRTGMSQHCPQGVDWTQLEMLQLGEVSLVHVSCNSSFVWVVDIDGQVFHRIGATAPRPGQLNPVWLPIDSYSEIVFTKVVTGPLEWMVWAVDNRRLTYVRVGISEKLPIGKEWVHVPGIQALDLCLSTSGVWAINTNGEVLFRYGVTEQDVSGNYWKKIPGCFTRISASSKDVLWAVNTTGQLVKCTSHHLYRRQDSSDPLLQRNLSIASEEGDWELV